MGTYHTLQKPVHGQVLQSRRSGQIRPGYSTGPNSQVPRPLLSTFQHTRCRAHKMLVGHRPVAIFRTAIWLLMGVTGSSSLGDLFCQRYGGLTESVPVRSRTPFETPVYACMHHTILKKIQQAESASTAYLW